MNKSTPAFIIGLISSILGAISAFIFWFIFIFIGAFATSEAVKSIASFVPLLNLASFVISLVGCFFCIKNAKVGGIIMLLASIISVVCFIILTTILKNITIDIILFWLPSIFIFIASLIALKKRR